jgi:electron transfer flavoprotein beta subunit
MRIVLLVKAVPVVGEERLAANGRTERDRLEPNGADEYGAEGALRMVDAGRADVTVLTMGPTPATESVRKLLAMGAARGVIVTDPALEGACMRMTGVVLAAALRHLEYDLVITGADTSDGQGGIVPAAVAARLGLPFVSGVTAFGAVTDGLLRVDRAGPDGPEVVDIPLPALVAGSQLLGEPRYPALRAIMAARSKEIETWSLADLELDPSSPVMERSTMLNSTEAIESRRGGERVSGSPDEAAARILALLAAKGYAQ